MRRRQPRANIIPFRRSRRRVARLSLNPVLDRAKWLVFPVVIAGVIAISPPAWISATVSDPGWLTRFRYSGSAVSGVITYVRDGDTVEVLGVPVRIANLDCAERGTAKGRAATVRMRELAHTGAFSCQLEGRKSYDREVGVCSVAGRDVGEIMISERYCRRWR